MLTLTRFSSLGDALRTAMVTYKSNIALIEADRHRENGRWTFRELRDQAERFAALLQTHGLVAGDRCAIVMQNQSKWVFSGLGAFWAGAVVVPIDYKLTAPEQLALVEHCKPRVLVTEYSTWTKMQKEAQAGSLETTLVLVTEAPEGAQLGRAMRWESEPQRAFEPVARVRDDLATIVYSSGTSGTPKGCMLTHENYLSQAQILGRMYPIEEDDRYFSVLPTNHAIDFMVGLILPPLFGAAIVHQRTLRAQYLRQSMKEYGITHMSLVPTIMRNLETRLRERLDELPDWRRFVVDGLIAANDFLTAREPNHAISSRLLKPIHDEFGGKLRIIFAGGTFVDRDLASFFYEIGIPVAIGYGLTEACTVIAVNDLKPFRADTVGRPVEGVEVEIREANDEGVGEVWVRGPTVMQGYLDNPELTAETIVDGWLRTGDLGFVDASGHLKLFGRKKNLIVTAGGKNVYPEDIESSFADLPHCEESCVFAANYVWPTGKMLDEQLMIVVRPEKDASIEALERELNRRNHKLADYKRLSAYVIWPDEFPVTASLKVKRNILADQLKRLERDAALRLLEHAHT